MTFPDIERLKINELYARYAWGLDTKDIENWADLFMADGSIEMPDVGRFTGRAEIVRYGHLLTDDPAYPGRQHWVNQTVLEGDESQAVANSYGMITYRDADGKSSVRGTGRYRDVLVKHEGRWKFRERVWYRWGGDVLDRFPKP
jgi:hypothetical protein